MKSIVYKQSLLHEAFNMTKYEKMESAELIYIFQVLNNTITIQARSDAYIYLKPTVPIACPDYIQGSYCNYVIWMNDNYNSYECTGGNIGSNQRCGVNIVGAKRTETTWWNTRQWEREIPMLIKHRSPTVYDNEGVYTLRLKVSEIKFNEILKGMVLDDVKVISPICLCRWLFLCIFLLQLVVD